VIDGLIQHEYVPHIKEISSSLGLFVNSHDEVLLAQRQKGGMGEDLWTGYGGKQEEGETIDVCMVREARTECGIEILRARRIGMLVSRFYIDDVLHLITNITLFRIDEWAGDPHDSPEMANARWFSKHHLPIGQMFKADELWIPEVMNGSNVMVEASYRMEGLSLKQISMRTFIPDNPVYSIDRIAA
jgi:8-oxo-dGTP diphosphatase